MRSLLGILLLPLLGGSALIDDKTAGATAQPAVPSAGLRVDRGEELGFVLPGNETLDFQVLVDVAILGSTGLGSFQLSAGTEPYRGGLASTSPDGDGKRVGWIRGRALGDYLNYSVDHVIETRILPQEWPHVIYRDTHQGTENRKVELMTGRRDGTASAWYRKDRHCKRCDRPEHFLDGSWPFSSDRHCEDCNRAAHRIWKKPQTFEIPEGAVDMLSAIHLARAMIREGESEIRFPMLDKDEWWEVTFTRASRREIETPAGKFACRSVKLTPKLPEGSEEDAEKFKGLFGIHGSLSIWLEENTGVPVKIEGLVPAGPFDVDVSLNLKSYKGTPPDFAPVR